MRQAYFQVRLYNSLEKGTNERFSTFGGIFLEWSFYFDKCNGKEQPKKINMLSISLMGNSLNKLLLTVPLRLMVKRKKICERDFLISISIKCRFLFWCWEHSKWLVKRIRHFEYLCMQTKLAIKTFKWRSLNFHLSLRRFCHTRACRCEPTERICSSMDFKSPLPIDL